MAISLLGISFATIFSGLSAALRTTDRLNDLERGNRYAAAKLRELVLDPSLAAGQQRSGRSPSGLGWNATTQLVDARPLLGPERPLELVRIRLEVSWKSRSGRESVFLESLKLHFPESRTTF